MGHADLGEQPHGLRMVAVAEQEGADDLLGGGEIAVGEERGRRHHFGGRLRERLAVRSGDRGVLVVAGKAVDALEHAPAHRQGGVDVHRAQQGLDRVGRVLERDVAQAALLVQQAEARLKRLEPVEQRQRLGDTQHAPQAGGGDQEEIAVLGPLLQKRLGALERLGQPPCLLQAAQAARLRARSKRRNRWRASSLAWGSGAGARTRRDDDHPSTRRGVLEVGEDLASTTSGRSGTSDLMNCAEDVKVLACELVRLEP